VACRLVLGGGTALCGAIIVSRRPKSQNGDQSWIGTIAIAAIVALVILILQADGVSNQLFRNWPS
jgi:hypothetical protein